jgi:hypothetical protein
VERALEMEISDLVTDFFVLVCVCLVVLCVLCLLKLVFSGGRREASPVSLQWGDREL